MPSDIEIAQSAAMEPIAAVAGRIGLSEEDIELYGKFKAKVSLSALARNQDGPDGKLVLVTAINPTAAGEGKTTITVGLGQALSRIGKRCIIALREPSLGPCMGVKGGAAGGGYAQVVPMEDINLHFTGDIHAVTTAHNLLAALLDNHLHQGNELQIDPRSVPFRRVMDMNERALRNIVVGLGGKAQGVPREDGFMISVASEVMAILCLAADLTDLKKRLGGDYCRLYRCRGTGAGLRSARERRHGAAAERRNQTESRPDFGKHTRFYPRRAVRQYRPRLQQCRGDQTGPEAG